jgi:phosphoadenosine phosphosulfate reductase
LFDTTSPSSIARPIIRNMLSESRKPCVTVSFQAGGVVLLHLLQQEAPGIPVLFLDTFHHFDEVYRYRDDLAERWKLNLHILRAAEPSPGLWQSSTNACCARHKSEPLFEALENYDMWFTALRRDQSPSRSHLQIAEPSTLPTGHTVTKVSPLADWTMTEVKAYATDHNIPLLSLYDEGFTSIGCEPCTSLPDDPNNPRSGRWRGEKVECGIHIHIRRT